MRALIVLIANAFTFLRYALATPFRLLAARHRPRWVRFRLAGDIPYRAPKKRRFRFGQKPPPPTAVTSLDAFTQALDQLARDPNLQGILLELQGLAVSAAKRDALAALLGHFRARGKRVVAWAVSLDETSYPVALAADEVLLSPAGRLDVMGFAAEATALSDALERVGVRAHFVRRGDYKTAPELFTHNQLSDIQRRTLEGFLDERWAELLEAIARGRKRTLEEARALVDKGPYSARRAAAVGLVDALVSESELAAHLGAAAKDAKSSHAEEELPALAAHTAALPWPPFGWRRLRLPPRVAVVPLRGMIVPGKGSGGPFGPQVAGGDAIVKAVRAAARDRRARAIVLWVDSPGGSALASELILEALQRAARRKPVLAYVERVAASGGYMAAIGAKEIWSSPQAIVGSIGVFAGKFEAAGLLERLGVHRTLLTRGENAGLFSTSRGFTLHERESLEAEVEETYQAFLDMVARARGQTKDWVHARAEGRVYSGRAALEAGLVDHLGGFDAACRRALQLAGVTTERFEVALHAATQDRLGLLRVLSGSAWSPAPHGLLRLLSGAAAGGVGGLFALCPAALATPGAGLLRQEMDALADPGDGPGDGL